MGLSSKDLHECAFPITTIRLIVSGHASGERQPLLQHPGSCFVMSAGPRRRRIDLVHHITDHVGLCQKSATTAFDKWPPSGLAQVRFRAKLNLNVVDLGHSSLSNALVTSSDISLPCSAHLGWQHCPGFPSACNEQAPAAKGHSRF